MVSFIPLPDPRSLLPPLLACLPTAFASPRPPPALLTLLSPILRQRLHLLSSDTFSSSDNWLSLLCWDPQAGAQVVDTVAESTAFELHPVSGEIDYGEIEPLVYRRLDVETLQARVTLNDLGLVIIYVWCHNGDAEGGDEWKVAEVLPTGANVQHRESAWSETISVANAKAGQKITELPADLDKHNLAVPAVVYGSERPAEPKDVDDDDYWALYDTTPGARPSHAKSSPGPRLSKNAQDQSASEADYFARYASVQPEMDSDDPSQDRDAIGQTSLNGNSLTAGGRDKAQVNGVRSTRALVNPFDDTPAMQQNKFDPAAANVPANESKTQRQLEETADNLLTAEIAIKQHVGTTIKSLFRLCRNIGMETEYFEQLVQTELQTLSLIAEND